MGDVEEGRARSIIRALKQNPQMVPPGLDVEAAEKDFAAWDRLSRIDEEVQRVAKLVGDTRSALGINIMSVAKLGYSLSKTFGAALGIGDLVKELGARFTGGRKKKATEPAPESTDEE